MKRLMMVAVLAVAQSGCVAAQADAPVQLTNALALSYEDGECSPDTTKFIGQGSLDVRGGENYLLAMRTRNAIPAARAVPIGDTPTTVGGSNITLTEFVYSYQLSVPEGVKLPGDFSLPGPEEDVVATYVVLPAGSAGDSSYVFVEAFGPKAFAQLSRLNDSGLPKTTALGIITTIKARGRLGASSNVESNEFSFPVKVFSSPPCGAAQVLGGLCRAGQDVQSACVTPPPTTP